MCMWLNFMKTQKDSILNKSLENFNKSEIYDGYYSECIYENYRYLPKFTQYIDFKELGKDLKLKLKDSRYKNDYYFDEKNRNCYYYKIWSLRISVVLVFDFLLLNICYTIYIV